MPPPLMAAGVPRRELDTQPAGVDRRDADAAVQVAPLLLKLLSAADGLHPHLDEDGAPSRSVRSDSPR